jgi:hypothetical protein
MRGIFEEYPDRGKPGISAPDTICSITLEVIQKAQDQIGIEVGQGHVRRGFPNPLLSKGQQELERVPVGRDRAGAHRSLLAKMIHEEALQQGWEGGCGISH